MIPVVHLSRKSPVTRNQIDSRAFVLNEQNMPKGDGTIESIRKIIDYLDVEKSDRYKRTKLATFCNIYAYDYAYLMGAYIPRVWWTESAIKHETFEAKYAATVLEMNVNSLYTWFDKYGKGFGWEKLDGGRNISDAQAAANAGKCVIMLCASKDGKKSGHIVAVVPETDKVKAVGSQGIYIYPVQSQAGTTNHKYYNGYWWKNMQPLHIYVCNH
jgi:hypothetical protein